MIRIALVLLAASACVIPLTARATASAPAEYHEAVELIHAFSGSGDNLDRANEIGLQLAVSHPKSGYSQLLEAELLVNRNAGDKPLPEEYFASVLKLCDEALSWNRKLAHAHVLKARAYLRASMGDETKQSIDAALALDPNLPSAMFVNADFHRRRRMIELAVEWYEKFIDATDVNARKSNAYAWMGLMYQGLAKTDWPNRKVHIAKADQYFQRMVELDPEAPWKNVNYAFFLNEYKEDFRAAYRHASKALEIMDFPVARLQIAVARYRFLGTHRAKDLDRATVCSEIDRIRSETGVSLDDAIASSGGSSSVTMQLRGMNSCHIPQISPQ